MATKLEEMKWKLHKKRYDVLFNYGVKHGLIGAYDKKLIENLRHIYYGGIPASILLLHGKLSNGYCYDPTLLLRFKKETYYEIYKPYNVSKTTTDEYKNCCNSNKQFYEDIVNTELSDFQPNGSKRTDLCVMIPLVQGIAEMGTDANFKKELNEYLKLIQYDERQIYGEMNTAFQKCLDEEAKKSRKM